MRHYCPLYSQHKRLYSACGKKIVAILHLPFSCGECCAQLALPLAVPRLFPFCFGGIVLRELQEERMNAVDRIYSFSTVNRFLSTLEFSLATIARRLKSSEGTVRNTRKPLKRNEFVKEALL